jgi:hypothetical protein
VIDPELPKSAPHASRQPDAHNDIARHSKTTQQPQNETAEAMTNVSTDDMVDHAMTEIDATETEKRLRDEGGRSEDDDADGAYSEEDEGDEETDESISTNSSSHKEQTPSSLRADVEKLNAAFPDFSKTYKITGKIGEGNTPTFILALQQSN